MANPGTAFHVGTHCPLEIDVFYIGRLAPQLDLMGQLRQEMFKKRCYRFFASGDWLPLDEPANECEKRLNDRSVPQEFNLFVGEALIHHCYHCKESLSDVGLV